jgi:Zn finger protein HypA/HybF involved in hydrogenase expression
MDDLANAVWVLQHPDNEMSTTEKLAELLESDENLEVSLLCMDCSNVFAAGADHLMGLDGCPLCGSEDLEVV